MSEARDLSLGPVTEARFAETFATRAIVDRKVAADLLGVDPKTLDALAEARIVRSVPKGAHRGYTERDLRAFLLQGPEIECAPPEPKPRPRHVPSPKVVNFSERRRQKGR